MKNIFLFSFTALLIFFSCKKYEEGPLISFRSKKERVANKWVIKSYVKDGVEHDVCEKEVDFHQFKKNGEYILSIITKPDSIIDYTGWWKFYDEDKYLIIHTPEHIFPRKIKILAYTDTFKINKLKEKDLWLYLENDAFGNYGETRYLPRN